MDSHDNGIIFGHAQINANAVNGNVQLVDGVRGSALDFTAQGYYMSLGDQSGRCIGNMDLCNDGYTVAFWIKQKNHVVKWETIFGSNKFSVYIVNDPNLTFVHFI